jgi:hypothetical protein
MSYRKANSKLGVSVELGTENVPDDGCYHVIVDGKIVYSTRVQSSALVEYDDIVFERDRPYAERRARERAHSDFQGARSQSLQRMRASTRKTGGRGGRGGV